MVPEVPRQAELRSPSPSRRRFLRPGLVSSPEETRLFRIVRERAGGSTSQFASVFQPVAGRLSCAESRYSVGRGERKGLVRKPDRAPGACGLRSPGRPAPAGSGFGAGADSDGESESSERSENIASSGPARSIPFLQIALGRTNGFARRPPSTPRFDSDKRPFLDSTPGRRPPAERAIREGARLPERRSP